MEVVSASQGVLGPLLGKLTSLLAGEYGRLKGVRSEILSLRCELSSMHAAVKKYTMLEDPDVQVKEWISIVRELAYDIEDCIDRFIHKLGNGGRHRHGGFKEFFRKTAHRLKTLGSRRGIANQIDDLKVRIKQVKELKSSYKLDDIAGSPSVCAAVDPRLSALFADEAHLVGIDGPRDDLVKWMLQEDDNSTKHRCRVLSIAGFGGLGKTTLANEVYRKIQGHFDCQVFVSVSQKPDIKQLIKNVIYKVPYPKRFTKDIDNWDEMTTITKLRELLRDKRYLVIIDDIWSISAWNTIKCAFPENNCSSRIIATTRNFDVASSCCPLGGDRMYKMEPLSHFHSKRLFFKRIFGSEDCCPDMLKEVSNEILKKCGGLPLAIISISSLLANRPVDKQEWEKVKRSIGSDLGRNQSLEGMSIILSLSYSVLPPNLKTCLLYLSTFPEDYVIDRERLVRRWIAEGFICEKRGKSQQEVAENYFYELINQSMVQPVDIGYDGKARACRVHDMMLELIISKSTEENFITVVNGGQTVWGNPHGYIRRLSIQHIDQEVASTLAKKDLSHVRSLTVTASSCMKHLPSLVEFETLRVLDFEGCEGLEEYDMSSMDKLFQLKYLSFRGTWISKLPSGIVKLHGLEAIDLRDTFIQEFPARIVQLIKLQHLLCGYLDGETKIPDGIKNMSNLRVISGFNITMSSLGAVAELGSLINLNVLDVQYISNDEESHKYKRHAEMLLSSLCKLGSYKLQSISIDGGNSSPFELLDSWSPLPSSLQRFVMITNYYFLKIPKCIAPALTSLVYLDFHLSKVTEEDLRILGELPALLSLQLYSNTFQKERVPVKAGGFQYLKEFLYRPCGGGLGTLLFEEGALPKLEKLKLRFFVSTARAYGFYFGIGNLPCLKDAEFTLCHVGATSSECEAAAVAISKEVNLHPNHPRVTLFTEEAHLVGIDGPRDKLANLMVEEENKGHLRVLSIVGSGGLGKTTLANEVYHKIQGHFHCRAFVSVSQMPDIKKIIKDVISQVISQVPKDIDIWDEKKSIAKLREILQDKRYLIIIDDIWSISTWNAIKCAFPENNCSCWIIATTRIFDVARSCCSGGDDYPYKMVPLSNLHSKRLFFKRIFGSEDCCPDMLTEVSNAILKKCGGLPLAIISISDLLANRPRVKEEWEKVKRSIGFELYESQSLQRMKSILMLSYNDLSPDLKTCFLYLSNFPEDYVIERERLVRRWIAEGFISEDRGKSRQEVAESYFYELINRSMVQPVDISYDGKVRACRVHDMMLDLIISRSIEENFITVVSGKQTVWEISECFIQRLSIQHIDQELASELANKVLSHVRSVTVTSPSSNLLPNLVEFETLCVLDFEGCSFLNMHDMNGMDKLLHLKYLSFRATGISELPAGIVMLHGLETLDLRYTFIQELPAGIVQLIKLQHLLLRGFNEETQIPIGIGNMTNLREISGFNITMSSVDAVEELGNLINLNVLDVRYIMNDEESHKYKRHAELLLSSLCKLGSCKLQSVSICGGNSSPFELLDSWSPLPSSLQRFEIITDYFFPKIPRWIAPALTSLVHLDFNLSKVTEEDLRILGELPALLFLKLGINTVQKERVPVKGRGFRCLKEFLCDRGSGTLLFEEGALPRLEKLKLSFFVSMAKAYGFYLGIGNLPCLKDAEFALCNEGATSSECKAAAVAIRKEVNLHPNHPRVTLYGEIEEDDTDDEES